jgi:hypothetical protein
MLRLLHCVNIGNEHSSHGITSIDDEVLYITCVVVPCDDEESRMPALCMQLTELREELQREFRTNVSNSTF